MDTEAPVLSLLENPFPGLRPFETEEAIFFFGREAHTAELLRRLSVHRFLAITGASGCGKSSLVYAGLLPALYRGYLVNATSRWRFATFRPGNAPIQALATALAGQGALAGLGAERLKDLLGATSGGLIKAVREAGLAPGESLLVVADQFEELFRFAIENPEGDSERSLFVSLLLRAAESDAPIYVALTMRSEYQGVCAQFPGLPEALNRGQYLVSRMTREQCCQAIVRPLELVGAGITPRLVNQILNDAGNDPDQLPVLQHALLRTYRYWQRMEGSQGDIDLSHYQAEEVGGIAKALALHADSILDRFPHDRLLAEKILRCLTKSEGRRPKKLRQIYEIVQAADEPARGRVNEIIAAFTRREDSLLTQSSPELEPETLVDITHESLIRKWPTLEKWVKEEAKSEEWYGDLARDVVRKRTEEAGLWQDPELALVVERSKREGWNEAWARQYARPAANPPFSEVKKFLADSAKEQAEKRRLEKDREAKLSRFRRLAWLVAMLLLTTVLAAYGAFLYIGWQHDQEVESLIEQKEQSIREMTAQAEEIRRQLVSANTAESAVLNRKLAELARASAVEQSAVTDLKVELQGPPTPATVVLDNPALLDRIQVLETELDAAKEQSKKDQSEMLAAQKRTSELEGEAGKLRESLASLQRTAAIPPIFATISQHSVKHLSPTPSAGTIAIGVGHIDDFNPRAELPLYIWTSAIPREASESQVGFLRLIAPANGRACGALEPEGRRCVKVRRNLVHAGSQDPIELTLDDVLYQIEVVQWFDDPDEISLFMHAVPPTAR